MNTKEARILTVQEVEQLRKPLPESWKKAAGLMQHKKKELEKHIRTVRLEWDHKRHK